MRRSVVSDFRNVVSFFFFFQAEDGIRDYKVTGVQTCALPICILVATVPGALVGVALGKLIEAHLRSPGVIALSTGAWALVMWVADRQIGRASCRERV